MMYVLYSYDFMTVSIVACADSIEKLIAYCEEITQQTVWTEYEKAVGNCPARWIIQDTEYEIQKVKGL